MSGSAQLVTTDSGRRGDFAYRRITVPLDALTSSVHAVPWAIALARRSGCGIDLVHVAVPQTRVHDLYGVPAHRPDDAERIERDVAKRVELLADEVRDLGVDAAATILHGEPPRALNDHVRTTRTDVVVVTTRDRGWAEAAVKGSVADSLVRHAHVPVLFVKPTGDDVLLNARMEIRRLLVPLDGSTFSDAILPHVMRLATVMGASVTLLGVVEPMLAALATGTGPDTPGIAAMPLTPSAARDMDQRRVSLASDQLETSADTLRAAGLAVDVVVATDGRPGPAIVEHVARERIDVVAMATHGRGALKRLFLGSVAQHVLHHASVPVLLYRPHAT